MRRISLRAIWLFFISYLIRLGIIPVFLGFYLISLLPQQEMLTITFYSLVLSAIVSNIIMWVLISFLWAWLTQHYLRYKLTDTYCHKEIGVLYKKYITIPYENIQNIEIDRPVLARMLGLSELRIETANAHTRSDGRLPGLLRKDAEALKEELLSRSHQAKTK